MDYPNLVKGDRIRLTAGPIYYQVGQMSSDQITLVPENPRESEIKLVKENDQWELDTNNQISFKLDLVNPLPEELNLTYIVLNNMELEDLISTCQADSRLLNICQSDEYWKDRLITKFGNNLKGLFEIGPEKQPILEGHHPVSQYMSVERRLTELKDHLYDPEYIEILFDDLFEAESYHYINELMYIFREITNQKMLPKDFYGQMFNSLISAIIGGDYPIDYLKEYLSKGYFPESIRDFIRDGDAYDPSFYLGIWKVILDTVRVPPDYVRFVFEESGNPDLVKLFEEYGYSLNS